MSDLIKRSDVIQILDENGWLYETDIDDLIKEIPTAYDIDKVVEELELHSFELGTDTLPVHYVRLNDAIKIVKQGGVSDDMCEWKKYPFDWFAGCDGCEVNHKQGDYCPRCGKRIKVKAAE